VLVGCDRGELSFRCSVFFRAEWLPRFACPGVKFRLEPRQAEQGVFSPLAARRIPNWPVHSAAESSQ